MKKVKLTINYLKKIEVGIPEKIADSETPSLQVWIGAQTIVFYMVKKVNGRQHNIKIGRWPDMTLEEARQAALQRLGAIVNYQDINIPVGRKSLTLGDAMNSFIEDAKREKTKGDLRSLFKKFDPIASKKINDVTREEIKSYHTAMKSTPVMANEAVKKLGTAISRLSKRINVELANPARGIDLYREFPRKRFLSEVEAPKIMDALMELQGNYRNGVQADALLVMIYTGARKSNVLKMKIDDITLVNKVPVWIVPCDDSKNNREIFYSAERFCLVNNQEEYRGQEERIRISLSWQGNG